MLLMADPIFPDIRSFDALTKTPSTTSTKTSGVKNSNASSVKVTSSREAEEALDRGRVMRGRVLGGWDTALSRESLCWTGLFRVRCGNRRKMMLTILPYNPALHRYPVALLALEVSGTSGGYPLPSELGTTPESAQHWLYHEDVTARWVALWGDTVVGHVSLLPPEEALCLHVKDAENDTLLEVDQLLVHTQHRRQKVGTALLRTAVGYAHSHGRRAVFSIGPVLSPAMVHLSTSMKLDPAGSFRTKRGESQIFLA